MKAIAYHRFGSPDVLEYADVDRPVPADNDVLIRVHAASLNPLDWHSMRGKPYVGRLFMGLRKPRRNILGVDCSGRIEAVGRKVTELKAGDEIFGACRGALAEYACTPETKVTAKPANLTFEQAAAVPVAALTALQGLRDTARVQAGQRVLINGAAGGVGTFAVQIAKSFGAIVTGVCSTGNVDMVRSLGADEVIDYTKDDFTRGGARYDVVFDCVGNRSLSECRRILTPKGIYAMVGATVRSWLSPFVELFGLLFTAPFVSQKLAPVMAKGRKADLEILRQLLEAGTIKPVIDRTYPLSETPEAMRYVGQRHARGKVVLSI